MHVHEFLLIFVRHTCMDIVVHGMHIYQITCRFSNSDLLDVDYSCNVIWIY